MIPPNRFLDLDSVRGELREPFPSGRMTPAELGDVLARLVWEGFSDFLSDPGFAAARARLGMDPDEPLPGERVTEELLIFHLWAHSRAVQLSFVERLRPETIRTILDQLHRAVFEDMVSNGTPQAQVPVFEQRVSARYREYYSAADRSDGDVGWAALEHVVEVGEEPSDTAAHMLRDRAVELAKPLGDYLEGVEIDEG